MKTLQISNGDLVMGPGGAQTISGPAMITQDLRCALLEPLGNDRFHPGFGSTLSDEIGGLADDASRFAVEQEVSRVIANYVAVQGDKVSRDRLAGVKSRYEDADIIARVDGITANIDGDSLSVRVALTAASGASAVFDTTTTGA